VRWAVRVDAIGRSKGHAPGRVHADCVYIKYTATTLPDAMTDDGAERIKRSPDFPMERDDPRPLPHPILHLTKGPGSVHT
jgi:hypothetical protein